MEAVSVKYVINVDRNNTMIMIIDTPSGMKEENYGF
jgi:hypothetical protein